MKRTHINWKNRDPDGYKTHQKTASAKAVHLPPTEEQREISRKTAISTQLKHPEIAKNLPKRCEEWRKTPEAKVVMSNAGKKSNRVWKERDPEGYFRSHSKAGKRAKELHPNMARETMKKTHEKYPELKKIAGEIGRKRFIAFHENFKQNDPKGYSKRQSDYGKIGGRIGGKIGGLKAVEKIRKNKPHIWEGVHFDSYPEMAVAKVLLKEPVKGKNCQIYIAGKEIDFYLEDIDLFVEYHPWDKKGLSTEEYQNQRQQVVDNSEYSGSKLIVIKNFEEVEKISKIKQEC
jgi:hypothetical protein